MGNSVTDSSHTTTLKIFNEARRRAFMQDILDELAGRPDSLLSFEEVSQRLRASAPTEDSQIREVPLDRIAGSVGRYRDFNRAFLPRAHVDSRRWTHIARLQGKGGLPPVDLFKVGEVYFVRDGNHRVSAARALKQKTIRARVVDVPVRVPLQPGISPDDLILKAGYADFLEKTELDRHIPDQRLELTRPGAYQSLLQHIEVHQFFLGLRSRTYPTLAEAAVHWYHTVYEPVVQRIRASGILDSFPGRTEADLYLWISENRARLQMRYGANQAVREAVDDFAEEHHVPAVRRMARRWLYRLFPRKARPAPRQPSKPSPTARQKEEE